MKHLWITLSILLLIGSAQAEVVTVTFGSEIGGTNTFVGGATVTNLYNDVINGDTYSPGGGYFDATEPLFQNSDPNSFPPGIPPLPDTEVILYSGQSAVTPKISLIEGYEEGTYSFSGLSSNKCYSVQLTIGDLDDSGLTIGGPDGPAAVETVNVYGNGSMLGAVTATAGGGQSQWLTTTLDVCAMTDANGNLSIGLNQIFAWDPLGIAYDLPPAYGSQSGIRLEQINITAVPEPASMVMLGSLGIGLFARSIRRKKK